MDIDAQLLDRYARSRDADAFTQLVRRHAGMVFAVARRVTQNHHDAEEVAQSCFMELARQPATIHGSLPGWLHGVATNQAIAYNRTKGRRRRHERAAARPEVLTPADWDDVAPLVDAALAELPEDIRLPMVLYHFQGRTQSEVAAELGVSQPTISHRLEEGVAALREKLKVAGVVPSIALPELLARHAIEVVPKTLMAAPGKLAVSGYVPVATGAASGAATGGGVSGGATVASGASSVAAKGTIPLVAKIVAAVVIASAVSTTGYLASRRFIKESWTLDPAIANVTLSGSRQLSFHNSSSGQWEACGGVSRFEAWADNDLASKLRVDYSVRFTPWSNGPAPVSQESIRIGYDGKQGRVVHDKQNSKSGMVAVKRADITTHLTEGLVRYELMETGLTYMPGGCRISDLRPLEIISILKTGGRQGPIQIHQSTEEIDGVSCVRFDFFRGQGSPTPMIESDWLDPTKGYALVKSERYITQSDGARSTTSSTRITGYAMTENGFWIPKEVQIEESISPFLQRAMKLPGDRSRTLITIDSVKLNDPQFDPAIFTIPIPPEYHVYDESGNDQSKNIKSISGSKSVVTGVAAIPQALAATTTRLTHSAWWWWPWALAVAVFGTAGVLLIRQRRQQAPASPLRGSQGPRRR